MSSPPRLSVIVPVRDRSGARLDACLRSLAGQGGLAAGDVEVVVSDFGSTPAHAASVAALADQHGARLVRAATTRLWNRSRALNIGIRAARGQLVLCTDADMIFAPNFLATVVEALAQDEGRLVVCRCHDLPEAHIGGAAPSPVGGLDFAALAAAGSVRQTSGTGACQAATRAFFERVRGYDEAFEYWGAEDDDMRHRALHAGLRMHWISDQTTMWHQWHPTMKHDRSWLRFLNKWRYRLTRRVVVKNRRAWGQVDDGGRP